MYLDEAYVPVGGQWRYLWRAAGTHGRLIDFRLKVRCVSVASKVFVRSAIQRAFGSITQVGGKRRNNRTESDHAALKRLLGYRQRLRT
ncbi:DDE-type integrase/transposase/recombinase [Mameliella sp.]|uniref:DDE-type integrase/transposase/recombinase n=1 Tax=Mameliella sp. TaxID=1924940 RepID=UPI003B509F58